MSHISLRNVSKRFGDVEVIDGLSVDIESGEFIVVIGPSGCGKSTLLRLIAGLEDLSDGEILIGGERVNELPARDRSVAMVFQSYALYPHMTVAENMGFSLKMAGTGREEARKAVETTARSLELTELLDRYPKQLSGGQRQRVAIGRAIVRRPSVFLFDEPLSNLDAALRAQTRLEIADLHRDIGGTSIYVTHDQVEAMTLADRILVLNGGRVEQVGSPMDVYRRPANLFVAGFIGTPRINVLAATVRRADGPGPLELAIGDRLVGPDESGPGLRYRRVLDDGQALFLGLRPEALAIAADDAQGDLPATVRHVERLGESSLVHVDLGLDVDEATSVVVRDYSEMQPDAGNVIGLQIDWAQALFFDDGGVALQPAPGSGRV